MVSEHDLNRVYFVPLRAYTYNDVYAPARHGYRRIILLPQFKKYKDFCMTIFKKLDIERGSVEKPNEWFDQKHMYDVKCWFGFPKEALALLS